MLGTSSKDTKDMITMLRAVINGASMCVTRSLSCVLGLLLYLVHIFLCFMELIRSAVSLDF